MSNLEIISNQPLSNYDDSCCLDNPRADVSSKMLTAHRRYSLSEIELSHHADSLLDDFKLHLKEEGITIKDIIVLPVYLYDHSGISLSTAPFSCSWDSGQVGYIYELKSNIRKEFNVQKIDAKLLQLVTERLITEVEQQSLYLSTSQSEPEPRLKWQSRNYMINCHKTRSAMARSQQYM